MELSDPRPQPDEGSQVTHLAVPALQPQQPQGKREATIALSDDPFTVRFLHFLLS